MKLSAELRAYGDADALFKCFSPEAGEQKRSEYKITKQKDGLLFEIGADDSTALRAILNSITKLLTLYEKMEKV